MFTPIRKQSDDGGGPAVDIAPLIDVVFILLIFFLVTTTFVKDTVLSVDRAEASTATATDTLSVRVSITADGSVYTEGAEVDLTELARRVTRSVARDEIRSVIIVPDREAKAGRVVEVMDTVRDSGMHNVAIAAERSRR